MRAAIVSETISPGIDGISTIVAPGLACSRHRVQTTRACARCDYRLAGSNGETGTLRARSAT